MSQQLAHIEKCFGQLYCKIEAMKCVGKNTTKEELLLDKLYIAYWISCGSDCDIECFLLKNCAHCKPTKNTLPTAPVCCGINRWNYIDSVTNPVGATVSNYTAGATPTADITLTGPLAYTLNTQNAGTLTYSLEITSKPNDVLLFSSASFPIPAIPALTGVAGQNGSGLVIFIITIRVIVTSSVLLPIVPYSMGASNRMVYRIIYTPETQATTTEILSVGPMTFTGNCDSAEWGPIVDGETQTIFTITEEGIVEHQGTDLVVTKGDAQVALERKVNDYKTGGDALLFGSFWANCDN